MARTSRCEKCGQIIIGEVHIFEGKKYCNNCYEQLMQERQQKEAELKVLRDYIKKIYQIDAIPVEVNYAIDKLIAIGKKPTGIKATLYYYYKILGNKPALYLFGRVIEEKYEEARYYFLKQQELRKINDSIDITNNKRIVNVVVKNSTKKKRQINYKMEDL